MKVHAEQIDIVLHKFPVIITELRKLEQEMMELKQELLKSIEDDEPTKEGSNEDNPENVRS